MRMAIYSEEKKVWMIYELQDIYPMITNSKGQQFTFRGIVETYGRLIEEKTFSSQGQTFNLIAEDALTQRLLDFGKQIREFRE